MQLTRLSLILLVSSTGHGSYLWGNNSPLLKISPSLSAIDAQVQTQDDVKLEDGSDLSFDPVELLDDGKRSEVFSMALSKLQHLKSGDICPRLAARVLVDNCQRLKRLDLTQNEQDQSNVQNFINAYAASLAVCDLETARQEIPKSCRPFQEATLRQLDTRDSTRSLHVSGKQIGDCLNEMSTNAWTSFSSNKANAVVFCQASRIDIEKEQIIVLHEKTGELLSNFMEAVEEGLGIYQHDLKGHKAAIKDYFQDVLRMFGTLRDEGSDIIKSVLDTFAGRVKEVESNMNKVAQNVADVERAAAALRKTLLETNSQQAHSHEAMADHTSSLESSVQRANSEVAQFQDLISSMATNMVYLNTNMAYLMQRQEAIDEQALRVLRIAENITGSLNQVHDLGEEHFLKMQQATQMASELLDDVHEVKASLSSWNPLSNIFPTLLGVSIPILGGFAVLTVYLGSYQIVRPSFLRNVMLAFAGLVYPILFVNGRDWYVFILQETVPNILGRPA